MDLDPVKHRATEQCQAESPEAHCLINPWVTAWLWTSLLWAWCKPSAVQPHDTNMGILEVSNMIRRPKSITAAGPQIWGLVVNNYQFLTEPPYQTLNWSHSAGKMTPWPTQYSPRTTSLKYSSWKKVILSVTGTSGFGVHSNTATLALATTSCYLSCFSQWVLQECLYPNCGVDMPQSKLRCSFQIAASTQGDTSTTAVLNRVNWPSHLKRLSTLNRMCSPQPPSVIRLVFVEATPHSTWTYRSFVLYGRAANRLAIRCHTPAVSSVGMALHLFDKTKSRHFISHSITHHFHYNPAS